MNSGVPDEGKKKSKKEKSEERSQQTKVETIISKRKKLYFNYLFDNKLAALHNNLDLVEA